MQRINAYKIECHNSNIIGKHEYICKKSRQRFSPWTKSTAINRQLADIPKTTEVLATVTPRVQLNTIFDPKLYAIFGSQFNVQNWDQTTT
eukprot:1352583-Ditylum_brightwellii.AAC.1